MTASRKLLVENLEGRRVLSADVGLILAAPDHLESERLSHHNAAKPTDVNADKLTSPIDALLVINSINSGESMEQITHMCDTNGDGAISPVDALMVVNELNEASQSSQAPVDDAEDVDEPEGEVDDDELGDDELGLGEDDTHVHQHHENSYRPAHVLRELRGALLGRGRIADQAVESLFNAFDEDNSDALTKNEMPRFAWTFLIDSGVDANQDSAITLEEIDDRLAEERLERFERLDDDGNGLLTAPELSDRQWERLQAADVDGNGISFDELEAFRLLTQFEKVDSNGDEQITEDEVSERMWRRLERFDANNDQVITSDEYPLGSHPEPVTSRLAQFAARAFRFARGLGT